MKHTISEFDCFYISYDEPRKEEFWAIIQDQVPWAQRVDGVKGFDSAHKACANASSTDRFITIDGDNTVFPEFWNASFELDDFLERKTLSWASRNVVNGLTYGNGGLKLWTRDFVLNMRTHENALTEAESVDFCWDSQYVQLAGIWSETHPNGSAYQAFRAGFREGVKMTLDRGERAGAGSIEKYMHDKNFRRLLVWASVGCDVENGAWCVYGARLGIFKANIERDLNISKISDYEWFRDFFYSEVLPSVSSDPDTKAVDGEWNSALLQQASTNLIKPLNRDLGLTIADLNAEQSAFFKAAHFVPPTSRFDIQLERSGEAL
jgi:hypothetical protein